MFVSAPLVIFTFAAVGTVISDTYKKGGEAVLSPGSVSEPITSVTWKHGADIAVERYGQETTAYRDFKGRCELNTTTGALTISNLTLTDSGSYTAEINNRIMKATEIKVITAVPKPTISTRCNPEGTQCTLTCNANITDDMGTITYFWKTGDRQIPESSSKQLNITKDDSEFVEKMISCQLENPVSSERSDEIMNPFTNGSSVGGIIAAVVIALIVLVIVLGLLVDYLIWRKGRTNSENAGWRDYFARFDPRNCLNRGRTNQQTPEQTQQDQAEMQTLIPKNANGAATSPENQKVTTQDQQGPVPKGTGNKAATSSENQEDPNQDQQEGTGNEAETGCENQEDPNQQQPEPVPKGTNKEAEMPNNTSESQTDPRSDQTPAEPTEPSSETTTNPENQEDPNQDQQEPVPKGTGNEAEMPNNTSEIQNEPGSDQTPAEPTEPSSETKTSAVAPNAEEPPDQHAQQEDENTED